MMINPTFILLIITTSWITHTASGQYTLEMCAGPPVEHRNVQGADYIIGGMFPVHYRSGNIYKYNPPGLMWLTAMMFAVEEINNSSELLPKIRLGYRIFDTCNTIELAVKESLMLTQGIAPDSISMNTSTFEQCPCVNTNTSVIGLVGDAASATTTKIASVLSATSTPQISYSATSTALSNKFLYHSFMRTIPPDNFQAILITDFMKQLGWKYVNVIACDDDYGRVGVDELLPLLQENDICLAVNEVYDVKNDLDKSLTRVVIKKIKDEKDASAVVLWCQRPEALEVIKVAEELQVYHRTWIATEGYGNTGYLLKYDRRVVQGLFGIIPAQIKYKPVMDWLSQITPNSSFANNPWLHDYWVNYKGCTLVKSSNNNNSNNNNNNRYLCQNDDVSLKDLPTNKYVNVINSVYAIAHALDNFGTERDKGRMPSTASELLEYVRGVNFTGKAGNTISFTKEGNPKEALYSITNIQYNNESRKLEFVNVGYWNYMLRQVQLNNSLVQYANNKTTPPKSSCTDECKPGYKGLRFGDKPCCWKCVKCIENTIQPEPNKETCTPCPVNKLPNGARTKCLSPSIKYLNPQSFSGGVVITLMVVGYVIIVTAVVIFIKYRNTPVVKASNRGLSFLQIFSMLCQLAMPVFLMQAEITKTMCGGILFYFVLFYTITVSVTFTKADRMLRVFEASKSGILAKRSAMKGNRVQYATVSLLTVVGVALCISMYLVFKVELSREIRYQDDEIDMLYFCDGYYDTILFAMVCYIVVIGLVCTVYAFKARRLPQDFNEARYTSYAMFIFLLTWTMAVPIYFSQTEKIGKSTSWCILNVISTLSIFVPMYLPKCYLILFKPNQNTEAKFRENLKKKRMKESIVEPSTSSTSMTVMSVSSNNNKTQ